MSKIGPFIPKIGHFWGKTWLQKWSKNGLGRTKSDSFSISHKNSWNYLSFKSNYKVEVGGNQYFPVYWKLAIFYGFWLHIQNTFYTCNFFQKSNCTTSNESSFDVLSAKKKFGHVSVIKVSKIWVQTQSIKIGLHFLRS